MKSPVLRLTVRGYFIALTLAVLVPALAFAAALLWWNAETEREVTHQRLLNVSRALIQAVDLEMRGAITVLESLRYSAELQQGDIAGFERLARRVHEEHRHWNSIALIRADGQQLLNLAAPPGQPLPNVADAPVIKSALAGQATVSELTRGRTYDAFLVGIVVPVYSGGQIRYALALGIPAQHFQSLLDQHPVPEGWISALVDSKGLVVARSAESATAVGTPTSSMWLTPSDGDSIVEGTIRPTIPAIGAFSRSALSGWQAQIAIPTDRLAVSERHLLNLFISGGLALLALSLALAYTVGRRVVRPIASLAASADAYLRGDAQLGASGSSLVEADQLAKALQEAGSLQRAAIQSQRNAEIALQQSQKLESLGQLTGGLAHDFNNLLAIIMGNLALAKKRVDPEEHRVHQYLDRALQGADRGAQLTQRLLSFARRQELNPRATDVAELAGDMLNLIRRTIGPELAIETQFAAGLPEVRVDPNQLELALLNLMVNARDAMPSGGTITLSARVESLDRADGAGLEAGRYVVLAVKDTGTGMDEATLARAIEPFFTTKGIGKGTGLGLSAVEGLAAQSGGAFRLSSRVGSGTIAEIWLPVAPAHPAKPSVAAPAVPLEAPGPQTVLVVDDDPLVAGSTADMLADLGHRPLVAHSGVEARAMLTVHPEIDIVLSDQSMPRMTGLELAGILRKERPTLPVVLVSGHAELPTGTDLPLLTKPFRQAQLAEAIAAAVHLDADDNVIRLRG